MYGRKANTVLGGFPLGISFQEKRGIIWGLSIYPQRHILYFPFHRAAVRLAICRCTGTENTAGLCETDRMASYWTISGCRKGRFGYGQSEHSQHSFSLRSVSATARQRTRRTAWNALHGSWLDIAEIELSALGRRQCIADNRILDLPTPRALLLL